MYINYRRTADIMLTSLHVSSRNNVDVPVLKSNLYIIHDDDLFCYLAQSFVKKSLMKVRRCLNVYLGLKEEYNTTHCKCKIRCIDSDISYFLFFQFCNQCFICIDCK